LKVQGTEGMRVDKKGVGIWVPEDGEGKGQGQGQGQEEGGVE
jgi:solute carrier family 25 protein 38